MWRARMQAESAVVAAERESIFCHCFMVVSVVLATSGMGVASGTHLTVYQYCSKFVKSGTCDYMYRCRRFSISVKKVYY